MKHLVLLLIAFFSNILSYGATATFHNIADIYGTSMSEPNAITKDSDGFIWISSKEGVLRLADNGFKVYTLPYTSMNVVSVEITCQSDSILAYTNQGEVFLYNPVSDMFENYIDLAQLQSDIYLSQVVIDQAGTLWFSTSIGLYKLEKGNPVKINEVEGPLGDMTVISDGKILTGGLNGIYKVDSSDGKVSLICRPNGAFPTLLKEDLSAGKIWVGTMSEGLYYVNLADNSFKKAEAPGFPNQYVRDIEIMPDSTLWCGIDGRGIFQLSRDGKKILDRYQENSKKHGFMPGNGIQDMYLDETDRLWVCSFTGGVSMANLNSDIPTILSHWRDLPAGASLANDYVYDIAEDSKGQLWIATNSGLSCLDPDGMQWINFFSDNTEEPVIVQTVCPDNEGNVWVGTYAHGAYVIDTDTKKIVAHHKMDDGILSNKGFVFDIANDHDGNLWLGGMVGDILKFIPAQKRFEHYPSIQTKGLRELNDSLMLVWGTNRLFALNKHTKEMTTILSDYVIRDVSMSHENLWIGTLGKGLILYNLKDGKTEYFGKREGFPSDNVSSVLYVKGKVWIGAPGGLYVFNPADKSVDQFRFPSPHRRIEITPNSGTVLKNGNIALGTTTGLLLINGDTGKMEIPQGKIYIDDIEISGLSIKGNYDYTGGLPTNHIESIKFDHSHSDICVNVLATGTQTNSPLFSYKLEGLDDNWTGPEAITSIRYANLKPGKYRLLIRLHNPEVVAQRAIEIQITPPLWETTWFRIVFVCLVVGIIIFLIRTYLNRINRRNAESKLDFIVSTSHDLRTSLSLIKAPIEILKESERLSVSERDNVCLALRNVEHLTALTTNLMDFQKIDTGKVQTHFTRADIVELIRQRIAMFSAVAENRSITITLKSDREEFFTAIDEHKMQQILDNLISNAIKYSKNNSEVMLTLTCAHDTSWVLSVSDHGIGIAKKDKKKLFREFYRGQNAVNSNITGSGIGLALVKKLVEIHGGSIKFDSKENEGTTFEITIPTHSVNIPEEKENINSRSTIENPDYPDAYAEEMNILIVEDNDDLREFIRKSLCNKFNINVASDGDSAWEYIKENLPDLVVTDVMMPGMDGFELCRLIKTTFETSHIPVIILTSLADQDNELRGIGIGADDYITKPFDIKSISQRISSIISNRRAIGNKYMQNAVRKPTGSLSPDLVNTLNDTFVKQATEVIMNNIENSTFGKDDFAKDMGVSTSLLFKKIKSLTGMSVVDFIKTIRLEQALKLMEDPKLSISDVAYKCGFSSVGYFSTVFKKQFGYTPTECRNKK